VERRRATWGAELEGPDVRWYVSYGKPIPGWEEWEAVWAAGWARFS